MARQGTSQDPSAQPDQAQANGPQQQASGTQSPLTQAIQQQIAQAMQPILGDLQEQVVQAVRHQMDEGFQQPLQGGQSQDGQPAAEQSPLQAVVEQARAVIQQVIAWLQRMLQAVRDWLTSLLVSLLKDAAKGAGKSMLQQGMQTLKPTAE
jgi:hypothetical protein